MGRVSPWVERFAGLVAPGGAVLDVAAGSGRHTRWFLERGHPVTAVDRDVDALLAPAPRSGGLEVVRADLEADPWPFPGRRFAAVVVTNYLHRPLLPVLVDSLAADAVLIYETYAVGQERFGRPSDPAFLLRPNELLDAVRDRLAVVAYEDVELPRPARVQRIAAVRGGSADG